jgi:hypothetical protein
MAAPESVGDYLTAQLRAIIGTIAGLSQEYVWNEGASDHQYPFAFAVIGREEKIGEDESGDGQVWRRGFGIEIGVKVDEQDSQAEGSARKLTELWWDRVWNAFTLHKNDELTYDLDICRVRIDAIELDEFVPAWAFNKGEGRSTQSGTITYMRGPLT